MELKNHVNPAPAMLRHIHYTWPTSGTVACKDVSLDVLPGSIHALVGENGAGKTTLGHIFAGVLSPDKGIMSTEDGTLDLAGHTGSAFPGVGLVRQKNIWPDGLKVWEAAILGRNKLFQKPSSCIAEFYRTAEAWGITCPNPKSDTLHLDAAALQHCQLVAALMNNPQFLVLDEPASDWNGDGKAGFYAQLKRFAEAGVAVLLISHRMEDVFQAADYITVMRKGEIMASGFAGEFDAHRATTLMFGSGFYPEQTSAVKRIAAVEDNIEKPVVLECRGISYGNTLHSTDFRVLGGEIFGIAGIREEGLKQLESIISGYDRPTEGSLFLNGQAMKGGSAGMRQDKMSYVPSDTFARGVSPASTVADNMVVLDIARLSRRGVISNKTLREFAEKSCIQGQVLATPDQQITELSAGNIQKVILQRELSRPFSFLLLADPLSGLDKKSCQQLKTNLKTLVMSGAAVLLLASDIDDAFFLADRLAVLYRGRLSPAKPVSEWDRDTAAALMAGLIPEGAA